MRDWSGYFWHRTSHRELMATPEFAALKAESVGVLFYLRLLAGMSRQEHGADDGTVWFRGQRADRRAVVRLVAERFRWTTAEAGRVVASLRPTFLDERRRSGTVYLVGFAEEQSEAPTAAADRKRDERLRKEQDAMREQLVALDGQAMDREQLGTFLALNLRRMPSRAAELAARAVEWGLVRRNGDGLLHVSCSLHGRDPVPRLPPSPPSTVTSTRFDAPSASFSTGDMSHTEKCDMSHRVIVESQSEESKGLRPSNSMSTGRGGEGGRRGPLADVDVYATDPVSAALAVTGEGRSSRARNGYSKQLRELQAKYGDSEGLARFRDDVNTLKRDVLDGAPIRCRGAVLMRNLVRQLEGR
jgi:hypothetical protein